MVRSQLWVKRLTLFARAAFCHLMQSLCQRIDPMVDHYFLTIGELKKSYPLLSFRGPGTRSRG